MYPSYVLIAAILGVDLIGHRPKRVRLGVRWVQRNVYRFTLPHYCTRKVMCNQCSVRYCIIVLESNIRALVAVKYSDMKKKDVVDMRMYI